VDRTNTEQAKSRSARKEKNVTIHRTERVSSTLKRRRRTSTSYPGGQRKITLRSAMLLSRLDLTERRGQRRGRRRTRPGKEQNLIVEICIGRNRGVPISKGGGGGSMMGVAWEVWE